MTRRQYRARWLTRRGIKGPELGESPHLATTLVGPIRNMRLFTDGVCIKLLTLLKSRVLHAKSPPVLMSHSSYVSGRVAASTSLRSPPREKLAVLVWHVLSVCQGDRKEVGRSRIPI